MEIKTLIKPDFVVLDEEITIADMLSQLQNFEKRTGLVFRKKKYMGMIEKKSLIKSSLDVNKTKIKSFVHKSPLLKENTSLFEAAAMFYQTELDYLPVERNKLIIGVVNSLDVANAALNLPELDNLRVSEVKIIKTPKVSTTDKLVKALKIMHEENVDHVPLFEEGKIWGVLSLKDIIRKYINWSPQKDFSSKFNNQAKTKRSQAEQFSMISIPVNSFVLNQEMKSANSMIPLKNAILMMYNNNMHDLVIIDNDNYKGLLTVREILRKLATFSATKEFTIQFVGLKDVNLNAADRFTIKQIAEREANKLQRKIKQKMGLTVHIKEHGKKDEGREKFSITLHVELPQHTLISEDYDWDVELALRKVFENITSEADKIISKQLGKDKNIR